MTKIIRQKLGNSKRRLVDKINTVEDALAVQGGIKKYDAAKYLMELENKTETFRRHINELEAAVKDNDVESERYANEYDDLDDILNTSEDNQVKLKHIIKCDDDSKAERIKMEEKDKDDELLIAKEKLRLNAEQENERLKILSHEKIELEKLQLEKMKVEADMRKAIDKDDQKEATTIKSVPCIKLPKLELSKFDGNILKWQEFWDMYEATINLNPALQPVDKFNYLKVQLLGEAKEVISGLEITSS